MTIQNEISSGMMRKVNHIDSLYLYSDLSVETIAKTVNMHVNEVQKIIQSLIKKYALEPLYEQNNIPVKHIMKKDVASLDCAKSAFDAATLMIKKGVGGVVVTVQERPFGMITTQDILCQMIGSSKMLEDLFLETIASRPLIYVHPQKTVEDIVDLMIKNNIRRVPVVEDDILVGIVTAKDLAKLPSATKKNVLAKSILDAISRSRKTFESDPHFF